MADEDVHQAAPGAPAGHDAGGRPEPAEAAAEGPAGAGAASSPPESGTGPSGPDGQAPDGAPAGEEAPAGGVDDPVAALRRERDEYLDSLQRLAAEFDNYRKRTQKELSEAGERALGGFVQGLLPVLDAIDLARAHGSEEVDQVASLLTDLLAKQGLERVDPKGAVFDPNQHEAVVHEAGGDDGVQTVGEVFRAGWLWKGRVLRPAMVKVVG